MLGAVVDDARLPTQQDIPEPAPILDIVIDQQRRPRIRPHISEAAQLAWID
jgi:hypothetical protein